MKKVFLMLFLFIFYAGTSMAQKDKQKANEEYDFAPEGAAFATPEGGMEAFYRYS